MLIGLEKVFPHANTRYCCKHIYAKFRQKFLSTILKNLFWASCRSDNSAGFVTHMDEIKKISEVVHKWLIDIPMAHWYKH